MLLLDETKLERRSLARGEFLFRQGDKVQAIYFIEEGRLRLDRRTFDGRSLVFGMSSAGATPTYGQGLEHDQATWFARKPTAEA